MLAPDQVLVTVGTPCSLSAVGSAATYQALVEGDPAFVLHAAFDAGLIDLDVDDEGSLRARWADGGDASVDEVERRVGATLRDRLGIRRVDQLTRLGELGVTDIAAPLPHDLAEGGLRRLAGITYGAVRGSTLRDMHGLFDDDPRLGPSLQSQLFVHCGLGALAALPVPLAELLPDPFDFRVAAAAAFAGLDSQAQLRPATFEALSAEGPRDKFAARLAASLSSHGPALVSTMLAPSYPLSRSMKNPALLATLRAPSGSMRVPQTPLNSVGACASSLIALCEIAPHMLLDYPGHRRPRMVLWTAADAAARPEWQILDAFGAGALMTGAKLDAVNEGRPPGERRAVADCLAPFDVDANGTVVGEGGSGLLVTTLDFALRNLLDITSIVVGWGQSGEAGGKAHFAGVGFGGENALLQTFQMAAQGHGYGVDDFGYLVAHATGTRTNSKTDLTTAASARAEAARRQGATGALRPMRVGTPKALGDGHTMGETGLKAVAQAIQHVLGLRAVGVPTLRTLDPELGPAAEQFELRRDAAPGDPDGGAICATQGFGGYNGAVALRAAHADAIARYRPDPSVLAAYLERWPDLRREREQRELRWRLRRGAALDLAQHHQWRAPD